MDVSIGKDAASTAQSKLFAGRISSASRSADESVPEVAAREMESLFATILVAELRKGLGEGFFGEGAGADTFNGWFDEQLGASIASRGSLGLADQVRESIIREQSAARDEEARHEAQQGGSDESRKGAAIR